MSSALGASSVGCSPPIQDDKAKSWKKLVSVVVLGAAGMISNHLLSKVSSMKKRDIVFT